MRPGAGGSGEDAYAAALTALPGIGPAALVSVLSDWSPREAWARVRAAALTPHHVREEKRAGPQPSTEAAPPLFGPGRPSGRRTPDWAGAARRMDPERSWASVAERGIRVTWWGAATYPAPLARDPQPPGVLFWRGDLCWLARPCVAIVGTRRATPDGRTVAFELGRDLARAGVCVVSGLALGIDGAAHGGALSVEADRGSAGPVGVAASGVDVPYPRIHATLWEQVAAAGAIISENSPGRPAQAWRFPSRNRVIAGLVRMVVVVESHATGGSLITAEQAISRGIDVRVVPGPVHSPACAGSNQLLYDGPGPVRDARDVLDGLGIILPAGAGPGCTTWPVQSRSSPPAPGADPGRTLGEPEAAVLTVVGWRPTSVDQAVERSGLAVGRVMSSLDALEARGWVARHGDWWVRCRRA